MPHATPSTPSCHPFGTGVGCLLVLVLLLVRTPALGTEPAPRAAPIANGGENL
jgi:hypothetical protein